MSTAILPKGWLEAGTAYAEAIRAVQRPHAGEAKRGDLPLASMPNTGWALWQN